MPKIRAKVDTKRPFYRVATKSTEAEDATIRAKIAASDAQAVAHNDASAVDDAQAAIAVIDEYERAAAAATRAETAAIAANIAAGG